VLCEDLNKEEALRARAKLGSRLALEILESGVVGNVPLVKRSLAACALGLLADPFLPYDQIPQRIANIYEPGLEKEFAETIEIWLGQSAIHRAVCAWVTLLFLEGRPVPWAREMAKKWWPTDTEWALNILQPWFQANRLTFHTSRRVVAQAAAERLESLVSALSISDCCSLVGELHDVLTITGPDWLMSLIGFCKSPRSLELRLCADDGSAVMSALVLPLGSEGAVELITAVDQMRTMPRVHDDWIHYAPVFAFISNACAENLALALESIAHKYPANRDVWLERGPWPLTVCVALCADAPSLIRMAKDARKGLLGDRGRWMEIEQRWESDDDLMVSDLAQNIMGGRLSLTAAISSIAVDPVTPEQYLPFAKALLDHVEPLPDSILRSRLLEVIQSHLLPIGVKRDPPRRALLDRVLSARHRYEAHEFWIDPYVLEESEDDWMAFWDEIGKSPKFHYADVLWGPTSLPMNEVSKNYLLNPHRWGLIRWMAYWSAGGRDVSSEVLDALPVEIRSEEIRLAILILKVCVSDVRDAQAWARQLRAALASSKERESVIGIMLSAIQEHGQGRTALEFILPAVEDELADDASHLRARADFVRFALLRGMPSGFQSARLNEMGLPDV
jgi:hypothetical protein